MDKVKFTITDAEGSDKQESVVYMTADFYNKDSINSIIDTLKICFSVLHGFCPVKIEVEKVPQKKVPKKKRELKNGKD